MTRFQPKLTPGHLARHAPGKSAQGREAALIDVAQDLLLRELADEGVLSTLAFKGGTAIRKVYAGASGRFSTDLDFAVRNLSDDPSTVLDLIAEACDGLELGGIRFDIEERRGDACHSGSTPPPYGSGRQDMVLRRVLPCPTTAGAEANRTADVASVVWR